MLMTQSNQSHHCDLLLFVHFHLTIYVSSGQPQVILIPFMLLFAIITICL